MKTLNSNLTDAGLLILRVFLGLAMCFGHGIGKWSSLFSGEEIKFADPFGVGMLPSLVLAVFAEVICSLLLALGLLTRWALIPLIVTMFVAIFLVHLSDGFGVMEKALLYGIGYLTLFLAGPGKYSVDRFLKRKK
ncbi:DoxX family protein [Winogradskyella undariae]|uniref:DoxX family protein n=1 Tax=Winogradskyella TaxID=286104 RepID=UPI00156BBB5C|nr:MULTISPECIES: DoxX family protein [Winogradskyella]NRR90992.1 DoxX family protein [Winogradskyella undariae]QNK77388.1 DoxX family protein [Winogradskyella sp. PAMC22761]QXP80059.1 DoxX family protein [Winogradskyella sp. HaHa_3_26]